MSTQENCVPKWAKAVSKPGTGALMAGNFLPTSEQRCRLLTPLAPVYAHGDVSATTQMSGKAELAEKAEKIKYGIALCDIYFKFVVLGT